MRSSRSDLARLVGVLVAVALLAGSRVARAEDEEAEKTRAALLEAAAAKDPARLAKVLDGASSLVGPSATFPDVGALADWLGALPESVSRLEAVGIRRAWMYVTAKRGPEAIPLLAPVVEREPKNAVLRAYLGEAKRQAGDVPGAVADLAQALRDGASDEHVLPSARKLAFELHRSPPKDASPGDLPAYATAVAPILALRDIPDLRQALVEWLTYDASKATSEPARAALLRAEAARQARAVLQRPAPPEERLRLARMAMDAASWVTSTDAAAAPGLPTAFDFHAAAVRLGERSGAEGHDLPEALVALAQDALEKGRYVLAERLARRRLEISDSPAARRVLLAIPPDVGD